RRPYASINFVTAHDGFTLHDLVSYNDKHNEANGEDNRDGSDHNIAWNHGLEGPTDDVKIVDLREQQKRNLLATLLLSQGVPMICGGDEMGRTQQGNNNAYCQDNELSWFDWELSGAQRALLDWTRRLIEFRARHPVFRRTDFLVGDERMGSGAPDVYWFRPDGRKMTERNRQRGAVRPVGRHGVERVAGEDDPRFERDLLSLLAVGVAPTVPALVCRADDPDDVLELDDRPQDPLAEHGMRLDDGPLVVGQRP